MEFNFLAAQEEMFPLCMLAGRCMHPVPDHGDKFSVLVSHMTMVCIILFKVIVGMPQHLLQ